MGMETSVPPAKATGLPERSWKRPPGASPTATLYGRKMLTIKKIELNREQVKPRGGWQVLVMVEAQFGTDIQEILVAIPPELVESMLGDAVEEISKGATKAVVKLVTESTNKVV